MLFEETVMKICIIVPILALFNNRVFPVFLEKRQINQRTVLNLVISLNKLFELRVASIPDT